MTRSTATQVIHELPAERAGRCSSLLPLSLEVSDEQEASGLEVTPKAALLLREYMQGKDTLPVRIFLTIGGCGMQSFGISPETLQPADAIFKRDGFTCVIEERILKQYGPIKIDSDGFAFRLSGKGISPLTGCGTCAFQCGTRGGSRCTGVCITCEAPCPTGLKIRSRRKQRKTAWI